MPDHSFDLLVIGAGPGGYVCAIRAAQLGMSVAIVDKEKALGGTCLRVGCIPSKALLESSHLYEQTLHDLASHGIGVDGVKLDVPAMLKRKDEVVKQLTGGVAALMKKNKVQVFHGVAAFNADNSVNVGEDTIRAKHVVIATGSEPSSIPGVDLTQDRIDTSTEALTYNPVPKHLVVIGAGVIGLELGSVWRRLGAEVTVLEYLDRIMPGLDAGMAKDAQKIFAKQGIQFRLGCKVTGVETTKKGVKIQIDGEDPVEADRVLCCVGRKPHTAGLNAEAAGVELDERGRVKLTAKFRTTGWTPEVGIYAIGDVVVGPMLAHKAEEEGVACAEAIATGHYHIDYDTIPNIVYTEPEVASVGKTEEQLKDAGVAYNVGKFPFLANGRAKAIDETGGMVKVLADKETDRVLGVHIVGHAAGDLIAECATAMAFGASSEDIARACHAHPTLAEAVKEASLAVHGRALHI
ncbi:MAG: dihydrolipoyl dehydrogenase [Planctomycetota bacterium]